MLQPTAPLLAVERPEFRARRSVLNVVLWCFGAYVLLLLGGYAILGKGFAYIGVPPVFVGEIGLLLAVVVCVVGFVPALWRLPLTWLLLAFVGWCALRTIPYIGDYGVDALRDGALWGYSIYALAVATVIVRFNAVDKVVTIYDKSIPWFLVLAPIALGMLTFREDLIPRWPWGPDGGAFVVFPKGGDLAVHYAGIVAFLFLGHSNRRRLWPLWILWVCGVALVLPGRANLLTIAAVLAAVAILRPSTKLAGLGLVIGLFIAVLYLAEIEIPTPSGRTISVEQVRRNIESIIRTSEVTNTSASLLGTREWREAWWGDIVRYTIYGDFFWGGKGFGINLADADGFQVLSESALRSPHNVHMTLLARAGVPGLLLWIAFQGLFAATLLIRSARDRLAPRDFGLNLESWIALYWVAFMITATFDVYLEGPQGGIWFWSVVGFGLAFTCLRKRSREHDLLRARRVASHGLSQGRSRASWV